ncbi:MAG: hypothetical protein HQK54_11540 [Oligoflexales bacterium]|nr:hypothetical protein [Oligoflexales bacterium]
MSVNQMPYNAAETISRGPRAFTLYLGTFLGALCAISYELMLAQTLTSVKGSSIQMFSITIGLTIFSLGMGAFYAHVNPSRRPFRDLLVLEFSLSIIGGISSPLILLANRAAVSFHDSFYAGLFGDAFIYFVIVLIGFMSGLELPILYAVGKIWHSSSNLGKLLSIDYFASFCGTLVFPLCLYPRLGIIGTSFLLGFVNLIVALMFSLHAEKRRVPPILLAASIFCAAFCYAIFKNEAISWYFSELLF